MANCFKLFLQASLTASAMIGIVLILRGILSKKVNPAVMLLLWTLILVRLCVPFTVISPVQLAVLPQQTMSQNNQPASAQEQPLAEIPTVGNPDPAQANTPNANANVPQSATSAGKADTAADFLKNIPWWSVCAGIWLTGCMATLFCFFRKAARFRKKLGICNPVADADVLEMIRRRQTEAGIKGPIAALECDFVPAPAVFGYRKPVILIPTRFIRYMDRNSLDAVVLHEICHIRCHDILANYVWLIAKALHWFNPLVWIAYGRYEDDVELCRDQKVARSLNEDGALLYSRSLLEAARFSKISTSSVPSMATSLLHNGRLKDRISRLMEPKKRSKAAAAGCTLLAACMLITCFTTACHPTISTALQTDLQAGTTHAPTPPSTDDPMLTGGDRTLLPPEYPTNILPLYDNIKVIKCSIQHGVGTQEKSYHFEIFYQTGATYEVAMAFYRELFKNPYYTPAGIDSLQASVPGGSVSAAFLESKDLSVRVWLYANIEASSLPTPMPQFENMPQTVTALGEGANILTGEMYLAESDEECSYTRSYWSTLTPEEFKMLYRQVYGKLKGVSFKTKSGAYYMIYEESNKTHWEVEFAPIHPANNEPRSLRITYTIQV